MTNQKEKRHPTETIKKIKQERKDDSGNTVTNILAAGNEYIIYEIDNKDINLRLKVVIDGYTDNSEQIIIDRFLQVKQEYVTAKGLLYRSTNFGMMKNRVAHALSSALAGENPNSKTIFNNLINEINQEASKSIIARILYSTPAIILTFLFSLIISINMNWRFQHSQLWQIMYVLFGSSLGGSLSILLGLKKHKFEEFISPFYFLIIGFERIFLAIVTGAIAFIFIKAKLIFSDLSSASYWNILVIIIIASFSESFIPNLLEKTASKENSK